MRFSPFASVPLVFFSVVLYIAFREEQLIQCYLQFVEFYPRRPLHTAQGPVFSIGLLRGEVFSSHGTDWS